MSENLFWRDVDVEGVQSVYISGDGTDCETCGWNYDEGAFHIWPDGKFYLSTRYGCYGGIYTEDRDEALKELEHCSRFMGAEAEIDQIKELLNDCD